MAAERENAGAGVSVVVCAGGAPHLSSSRRRAQYKKKNRKKRYGRLERLKSTLKQKEDKIARLNAKEVRFRR
jgi:hypothetical protein